MSLPAQPEPQFNDTLRDLLNFLRKPQLTEANEVSDVNQAPDPLQVFIHLLLFSFGLSFGSMMLLGVLKQSGLVPELPHAMEDVMKELPFIALILLAAVVVPAIEEFAFRLWLVYKKAYFIISLWLISFFLYSVVFKLHYTFTAYAILAVATLITIFLLSFREATQSLLENLYTRYYGWFFYSATVLFAVMHLMNFKLNLHIVLLTPVLVLPQFLLGLVLGYIRVKQGIGWAIALHAIYNGILLSLAYTGMQAETPSPVGAYFSFF